MTDQFPNDTPPSEDPFAETTSESTGSTWGADTADAGTEATPEAREWMTQLESMIRGIATQAAPVAKEIGAKAAELAAVAAVKAGPAAQRAAELTSEYGSKFAERAQAVAADLRSSGGTDAAGNGMSSSNGHATDAADTAEPAPDETSGSGV
jgi:hypothetical protein